MMTLLEVVIRDELEERIFDILSKNPEIDTLELSDLVYREYSDILDFYTEPEPEGELDEMFML